MRVKSERTGSLVPLTTSRTVAHLSAWAWVIHLFSMCAPTFLPMKGYNTIGTLHYAVFVFAPIGAWINANNRVPLWLFIVFGASCTVDFDFRLGHRWSNWVIFVRRTSPFAADMAVLCGISIGLGLVCRLVARLRRHIAARRADRGGSCRECRYDLTGNVSGICPECGTPTPIPA